MNKIYLTGDVTIATLIHILSEIASFCGEDSKMMLANSITLDIGHFVESPEEQEEVIKTMLDALAKYPVQVTT